MACEIVESPGGLFALWGEPTKQDVNRIADALRRAVERYGEAVTYVTRVPRDASPPEPPVRQYINDLMPKLVECCSTYHVVLEGDGFAVAVKRAMLLSLFQIGKRRGTFFVHQTCDGVIAALDEREQANAIALLRLAQDQGLLNGGPPVSLAPAQQANRSHPRS